MKRIPLNYFLLLVAIVLGTVWYKVSNPAFVISQQELKYSTAKNEPIDLELIVPGVIKPFEYTNIFASSEGVIERILVKTGQKVIKGQEIIRLNLDVLNSEMLRVKKELVIFNLKREQFINGFESDKKILTTKIAFQNELIEIAAEKEQSLFKLQKNGSVSKDAWLSKKHERSNLELSLLDFETQLTNLSVEKEIYQTQFEFDTRPLTEELDSLVLAINNPVYQSPVNGIIGEVYIQAGESPEILQALVKIEHLESAVIEVALENSQSIDDVTFTAQFDGVDYPLVIESTYTDDSGQLRGLFNIQGDMPSVEMFSNTKVVFNLGSTDPALTIERGPFIDSGLSYLFVKNEGLLQKRFVSFGKSNEEKIQVVSGIDPGDQVVISDTGEFDHLNEVEIN